MKDTYEVIENGGLYNEELVAEFDTMEKAENYIKLAEASGDENLDILVNGSTDY